MCGTGLTGQDLDVEIALFMLHLFKGSLHLLRGSLHVFRGSSLCRLSLCLAGLLLCGEFFDFCLGCVEPFALVLGDRDIFI